MKYKHGLHFEYPNDIHGHMIAPEQVRNDPLDGNFKFYDKRKAFRFKQWLLQLVFIILVFPVNYFRYGCKIKGRHILKEYKSVYKGGFITVCNHVFEWDYICVRSAMRPKRGYMTIWKNNHNSSLGKTMRVAGSIPIPDKSNIEGFVNFNKSIGEALNDNRMIHFYPEGSMWYFYEDIREYLPGAFHYAVIYDKPVIPLVISFRPPKGIFKLWKRHGAPCVTIEICEPIFPNKNLSKQDAIKDMSDKAYSIMKKTMEKNTPEI